MLIGAFILALGLILAYAPSLLSWFGKLPGDIRIENTQLYIYPYQLNDNSQFIGNMFA